MNNSNDTLKNINFDTLKGYLCDYVNRTLTPSKDGYHFNCPICGSGTHSNGTGAFSINEEGLSWKCFSCDNGGDIIDLYRAVNKCDLKTAVDAIERLYKGVTPMIVETHKQKKKTAVELNIEPISVSGFEYLNSRALLDEEMLKKNVYSVNYCGYEKLAFKNDAGGYFLRGITPNDSTPKKNHGDTDTYGIDTIKDNDIIYIVEGQIDALSIRQLGACCVGLGGAKNVGKLINRLKALDGVKNKHFVIIRDADNAGIEVSKKLSEYFFNNNISHEVITPPKGLKDANDWLKADSTSLLNAIEAVKENRSLHSIDTRLNALTIDYEPIEKFSTGFNALDKAIGGGLEEVGLSVIGAPPATGKSALCLNIMDNVAKDRQVIYFTLEMSEREHFIRSLVALSKGEKSADEIKEALNNHDTSLEPLFSLYRQDAKNRFFVDGLNGINFDGTAEHVKEITERFIKYQATKKPLVIIDYLQLLNTRERADTEKMKLDKTIAILKQLASKCHVIVISSLSREGYYKTPSINAFKESGAIEYTASVAYVLTYTDLNYKDAKGLDDQILDAQNEAERKLSLYVVKAREFRTGQKIDFIFTGDSMQFTDEVIKEKAKIKYKLR